MYIEHLKSLNKVYIIRYDVRTKNLNSNKLNVDPNSLFTIFITMVFTIVHMHRALKYFISLTSSTVNNRLIPGSQVQTLQETRLLGGAVKIKKIVFIGTWFLMQQRN